LSEINIVARFGCAICETVYANRCDAVACWVCCAIDHRRDAVAYGEDEVDSETFEIWTCPDCAAEAFSEEDAIDCCAAHRNDPPRLPSAAELEAAGQIRLL